MRQQMYMNRHRQGAWYVRYPNGRETGLMNKDEAKNLAVIFNGELHFDSDEGIEEAIKLSDQRADNRKSIFICSMIVILVLLFIASS
jgi:hypothetical protein